MKPKILFISKNKDDASTRYRALQYFSLLQKEGWETTHIRANTQPIAWLKLLKQAKQSDFVVVLRKTFNTLHLKSLRAVSKKLIFDFDDAIFTRENGTVSNIRQKRFSQMMKHCDQVWAGNSYLAQNAAQWNTKTLIVPTVVETAKYIISTQKPHHFFDLVWIGSSSTKKYLEAALPTLELLAKQIPTLRLKIIADFSLTTQHLKILPIRWSEAIEAPELASAHVGIAPMYDDAWTKGKCALKIIQYMAAGLPVISSPVGANKDIIIDNQTGFLAETTDQWRVALQQLIEYPELRHQMGTAGQERVKKEFSIDAVFHKIQISLHHLAG